MSTDPAAPQQRWFLVLSPDGAARTVSNYCAKAFIERFGTNCTTFDSHTYRNAYSQLQKQPNDEMTVDLLNQSLVVSCLDFSATHLLVMALSPITLFTLNLLRKLGVKTMHWFFEDYRKATYWKDVLPGYDHFCAIQRGPLPDACKRSNSTYHFLPTATDLTNARPFDNRSFDVGFIGIPSRYRIAVLEFLLQKGLTIAIGGSGWSAYRGPLQKSILSSLWVTEDESYKIMGRSKIGINLSVDEPIDREIVHISPRVYDILAAGCVLVSENAPLLFESIPGCNFHTFDSPDQAYVTIRKVLVEYPALAETIEKNRQIVIKNHTFAQRVETLVRMAS
jgi:spore maturation protein CgeB